MMKNMRFSILIVLLAAINATIAAEEPTLKFRSDGSFKIAQFTDLHLRTFNQGEVTAVYSFMDEVIRTEKPDLLVITGDVSKACSSRMDQASEIPRRQENPLVHRIREPRCPARSLSFRNVFDNIFREIFFEYS